MRPGWFHKVKAAVVYIPLTLCSPANCRAGDTETGPPVAIIDTTLGRIRCILYAKEAPTAVAAFTGFADGSRVWWSKATDAVVRKPFYNGTRLYNVPTGIRGGTREAYFDRELPVQEVPAYFIPEAERTLRFDRPGRLAVRGKDGLFGAGFVILDHANSEADGDNAVVIGQCDSASVPIITEIAHRLAAADDHPEKAIAINRILITSVHTAEPPVSSDVVESAIVPKLQPTAPAVDSAVEPSGPIAVITTTEGDLSCRLFTKQSPIGTGVLIGLANGTKEWTNPVTKQVEHGKHFYDGMIFDRVIPDFVIQTGDFTGDISGATDIGFRFRNENTPGLNFDRPGRLAFGNNGPDTNTSEIFITEHPMRRLNGGFTIIGQCDDASVRMVEKIARVPRDAANRPVEPVRILHVSIVPQ